MPPIFARTNKRSNKLFASISANTSRFSLKPRKAVTFKLLFIPALKRDEYAFLARFIVSIVDALR